MPHGTARRRCSMAKFQRILCQWGRTVAVPFRNGARCRAHPSCRCHVTCATSRAAQQSLVPGTSWTPRNVNRCRWLRAGSPPATTRGSFDGVHAARAPRRAHSSERLNATAHPRGTARIDKERRGRCGLARRPVSGERAERSRAASRARRAAGAWRCVMVGGAARAASTGLRCQARERPRDAAAAGVSARRGGMAGASRAGRRREERPPTASLFAVRERGCSPAAAKPGSRSQAAIEEKNAALSGAGTSCTYLGWAFVGVASSVRSSTSAASASCSSCWS